MTVSEFVTRFKEDALRAQEKSGIDRRFILAQAALESGWGKHAPGNMFFGVKASKNTPPEKKQLLLTSEVLKDDKQGYRFPIVLSITKRPDGKYLYRVKDWFRKYQTPEECFNDHAGFFYRHKRYAEGLKVKDDPYKFAEAVAKAGYATDPSYADKLKRIIKLIEQHL
jgi:flagellar protein FlgJ